MPLFSIGHSNHILNHFLDLLTLNRIEALADVRSIPRSRFRPHFNQASLRESLKIAGIDYLFLGQGLGGRPEGAEFYDPKGNADYPAMMRRPEFEECLKRLMHEAENRTVAMMCSEEDPLLCHRYWMITPQVIRRGMTVAHIRKDGRIQTTDELAGPGGLFGV